MFALDGSNDFQARAADRLTSEQVGWLSTIGADGTPQPSPIWFLWDGADKVLFYSQGTPKVRNITRQPRVSFHFNSTESGGNVVIFTGSAVIDESQPPVHDNAPYIERYGEGIKSIDMTNETFAAEYHVPIVMTIEKVRGF